MALSPVTERIAGELDYDLEDGGILVIGALNGGAAARAGLVQGTVIQEVNQRPVNSIEEFTAIIEQVEPGRSVILRVRYPNGVSGRIPLEIPE